MGTAFAGSTKRRGAVTPQSEAIPGREAEMAKNDAGGVTFVLDDWARLDRFLILGSEGGTYYASEKKLTLQNAAAISRCIIADGPRVVARIVEISDEGRAPKNDPALFALALCASAVADDTRRAALRALPKVARIGTHLFHFAEFVNGQRGWGRALKRAVGDWYNLQPVERLISQVSKYQQRDGWSNRDLLRLSHPKTADSERKGVYDWACGRKDTPDVPHVLRDIDALMANPDPVLAVDLIHKHELPRESIPTQLLNDPEVWAALLAKMPLGAMVRNLGKMSAIDLLKPMGRENKRVVEALTNAEAVQKARLHPLSVLLALKAYEAGRGEKGSLTWTPVPKIVAALDDAFYLAFKAVKPTGKRILCALDVSGSMSAQLSGTTLSAREAATAMAMTFMRTEEDAHLFAFDTGFKPLAITAKTALPDAIRQASVWGGGGTDCSMPMLYADERGLDVDAFVVLTDNETWAGRMQPVQALAQYRKNSGIPAKLIVVGMTSSGFTIADPKDAGMMDVVGFDAAAPQIIADFIRG